MKREALKKEIMELLKIAYKHLDKAADLDTRLGVPDYITAEFSQAWWTITDLLEGKNWNCFLPEVVFAIHKLTIYKIRLFEYYKSLDPSIRWTKRISKGYEVLDVRVFRAITALENIAWYVQPLINKELNEE